MLCNRVQQVRFVMPSHHQSNRRTSNKTGNRKSSNMSPHRTSHTRSSGPDRDYRPSGRRYQTQEDPRGLPLTSQQAVQVLQQVTHKHALSQTRRLRSAVQSLQSNSNMPPSARNIVKLADRALLNTAERLLEKHGPAGQVHVHVLPANQNQYPSNHTPYNAPPTTPYHSKPSKPKPPKPHYVPNPSKPPKHSKPLKPAKPSKPHAKPKPRPPPGYPAAPPGYPTLPAGYPAFPGHPGRR